MQHTAAPFDVMGVTTSEQPRYGRHARRDEPDGTTPPAPSSVPAPAPRPVPPVPPQRPAEEGTAGVYRTQARHTGPDRPEIGERPSGPRAGEPEHKSDDEEAGPNPYLPCEDGTPEVRLAPGGAPGTLALLAGLAGLGLALFPIVATVAWPLTIVGLVLGVVGLRRIRTGAARNAVTAATGLVLSAAGLVLCVTWLSMFAIAGVGSAGADTAEGAVPAAVR